MGCGGERLMGEEGDRGVRFEGRSSGLVKMSFLRETRSCCVSWGLTLTAAARRRVRH